MRYTVNVEDENGENRLKFEMDGLAEDRKATIPYGLLLYAAKEVEMPAMAEGAPSLKDMLAALLEEAPEKEGEDG